MSEFLLIHGSWFGAWCWDRVIGVLRDLGHGATAIDLPGHGEDRTPLAEIEFQDYVNAVIRQVAACSTRFILVGHSMAATVAVHAAGEMPEQVIASVALAGLQVPAGMTLLDGLSRVDPRYMASIVWSDDRMTALISPEGASRYLYQLSPEIAEVTTPRLTPEPIRPFETPLIARSGIYRRVPHYYIRCTQDKALLPSIQTHICEDSQPAGIFEMSTDHCPFFSAPEELADILVQISARISSG